MAIPTRQRIRRPAEYRRVFTYGDRTSGDHLNITVVRNGLPISRVGLSVSKRVGNAVARNLVKRRMRHALAEMNIADGWDVVVVAKPQAKSVSFAILDGSMQRSLKRLGIRVGRSRVCNTRNSGTVG